MITINNMKNSNKYFLAFIALFILPISGLSIDIYVPSLPAISHFFGIDKTLAQLTVTTYMLGLGIMQFFAGGITDSFGRKKPFLISMVIYIIATLLIPNSQSIYQLLSMRFIQGIAVGVMVVPLRSVVADLFEGRELYKMMNYMVMAWSIGPIIAPAIGGYLQHYFGWQANFYFLTVYSLVGFLMVLFYLPETSIHRHPFHLKKIFHRTMEMLCHKTFLGGMAINGCLYSIVILFAVTGSFLIQKVLHYTAIEFGHMALLVGLAWFLGATSNRFLTHIDFEIKERVIFSAMLIMVISMVGIAMMLPMNIYTILIPVLLLTWMGGILFPNYFARGMALFPKASGSANALFGAFVFFIAGFNSSFSTVLKSSTQLPLVLAYVGLISLCILIRYMTRQRDKGVEIMVKNSSELLVQKL